MPPNQKKQKLNGQQTIGFGASGLQLEKPPTNGGESLSSSTSTFVSSHHGGVESWPSFSQPKYTKNHPWLMLKPDGMYCCYCFAHQPCMQSGTTVFITSPFTGNCSDKLLQHERSGGSCTELFELP